MKKGKDMSITSPDMAADSNVNTKVVEEQRVVYKTFDDREVAKWTPEDLIKVLETIGSSWSKGGYVIVPLEQIEDLFIIFPKKILEWEEEHKITFDQVSKLMHLASERPIGPNGGLLGNMAGLGFKQEAIDFLGQFVLLGEKDARYYDLVEMALTAQSIHNEITPLASNLEYLKGEFQTKILDKLPKTIQDRLAKETYYFNHGDRVYCFSLLGGTLVYVD